LQQECDAAVRWSAWLAIRRRPRLKNGCAAELSNVPVIAKDSRQPAAKSKTPNSTIRSNSAVTLGMKISGVMSWCDAAMANDPSSEVL